MPRHRYSLNSAVVAPVTTAHPAAAPSAITPPIIAPPAAASPAAAPPAAAQDDPALRVGPSHAADSDPLAMGPQQRQPKSEAHHFRNIQKEDPTYIITEYNTQTTTGILRSHVVKFHLHVYITELRKHKLKVGVKEVRDLVGCGWILTQVSTELDQNPELTLASFGTPPGNGGLGSQPGTRVPVPADDIPDFTINKMHWQLVKFIMADDQASDELDGMP
ncbi:hypothetical protein F4604DRAFT_1933229 [Suillus subluteus]|nr:hypothetical protein F4604DRAFT_1933229 [Suillus subluteus]